MKTSRFLTQQVHAAWQRKGLISTVLLPLSWVVRLFILQKRQRHRQQPLSRPQTGLPVIVVGNLVVGGTGKTPVVIALCQALQAQGWRPGIISRGYGARIGAEPQVGQGSLSPLLFGDEPALIAHSTQAPVAVHPRRALALQALQHHYPEVNVVIADDGLQHLALERDIEIVVQDARGLGNGRVLPAGPLREPADKLAHVDIVITNLTAGQPAPAPLPIDATQLIMQLAPSTMTHLVSGDSLSWDQWHADYNDATLSAVAAIGQPERFFSMLRACGLALDKTQALPDHDPFDHSPFQALSSQLILITAKDAVKCARFNDDRLWVVNVDPQFSDPAWLDRLQDRLRAIAQDKKRRGELNSRS